jgi:esterase
MSVALSSRENGQGRPLILLHGLFGSARNWHSFSTRLADRFRIHALDLRNHGESPWADEMNYLAMAEDVASFITARGLTPAAVMGHSMGGKTAMALALQHSQLVERLIVLDIAPVVYEDTHTPYIRAMQNIDVGSLTRRSEAEAVLKEAVPEESIRSFLLQNLVQRESRFEWRVNLASLASHMPEILGFPRALLNQSYSGPTCVIYGSLSDYVQVPHRDLFRRMFPNVEFQPISDARHWVHVDQPQALADRVMAFLARA